MIGQIFISYAIKDKDVADDICGFLENSGLKCWIAPRDVLPGSDWGEAIIDAISQSRLMIIVHSENANRSMQIKREVERATSKGIPIIPFRIEDVPASKFLEYHLSTAHWLDAVSPPLEPHLRYLSEMVSKIAEAPWPAEPATQTGPCAECGAAMPPGAKRCDACGHVPAILSATGHTLPGAGRRWKPRRRWPLRLRSRWAKIGIIVVVVAALGLGIYFFTRKDDAEAYVNRAGAYLSNQEFDQAIEEITKLITKDPASAAGYRFRGYAYYQRALWRNMSDDLPRAVADLNKAIKLDPRDAFTHTTLGMTYTRMGDIRGALEAFDNALKLDRSYFYPLKGRGFVFYNMKEYDRAIEDFTEAIKIAPKDLDVLLGRGYAYLDKGSYDAALTDFQSASDLSPSHPAPYKGMSEVMKKLGRLEEAIEFDRTAIRLSSGR